MRRVQEGRGRLCQMEVRPEDLADHALANRHEGERQCVGKVRQHLSTGGLFGPF